MKHKRINEKKGKEALATLPSLPKKLALTFL
jgi:hypothetical protein